MGALNEPGVHGDVIDKRVNHTVENKIQHTCAVPELEQREAWRLLGERLDLLTRPDTEEVVILRFA